MPAETPENAGYMIAAYVVAPVILGGYLAMLWRRVRKVVRSDGRTVGRSDGQKVGRSDGQTVRGADGQTVGRSDDQTVRGSDGENS